MTRFDRITAAAGAVVLIAGLAIGPVEAMPIAASAPGPAVVSGAEPVAYRLRRRYPGYYSPSARAYRHMRRLSPNYFCRKQPSRCR